MEGVLYKWTNYLSGWQPRWFLLCGGILSYYDSQEDAWKGCKGSIQMAVCEIQEFTENTEALKTKMSELRLYCNLLVQQVHKTKEASISAVSEPEIKHSVLSSHTSTERQMELNPCENGSVKAEVNQQEQALIKSLACLNLETNEMNSDVSVEDHIKEDLSGIKEHGENKLQAVESLDAHKLPQSETNSLSGLTLYEEDENENGFPTFFSVMSNRFSDIELQEEEGIPTEEFLESCYAIVPVLDKLGPTVFAPVKMDFVGNIKKINQKFITNKEEFDTLQKIVLHEVSAGVAQVRNSATEALLWLKRGLKFLKGFLTEVKNGEKNIQTALNNAYGRTLRQHHGWVVRGVFALALRAAPTYEDFVAALSVEDCDPQEETFYKAMQRDLNIYLPAMEKQLNILDTLYEVHGLESDEVV
ncbi:UNVERIFIED_CONTAM: hypothetical protein H355_011652 [Colinus virginianus]|nr:hypothetical protein H355_011652 [Colinus virginianus]